MRRAPLLAVIAALAAASAVAACHGSAPHPTPTPTSTSTPPSASAPQSTSQSTGVTSQSAGVASRASSTPVAPAPAGVPAFDHVVVVVLENHALDEIVGNPDAPFVDGLARGGALFTNSYATDHPSQPNYLVLFSGSTQGVTDDGCPVTSSAPNLATALLRHGRTFAGFSEGLPAVGSTVCSAGAYARKHNPWSDFTNVPAALNRPLTSWPDDLGRLPTVAFVIPDLAHDMHDGSIAESDAWLRAHLGRYAAWARTHRSLLVLTFDEDDRSAGNRIVTVFAGAQVRAGRYDERIDHYRVLRTIADAAGVPAPGAARTALPIRDVWTR